MQNLTWPPNAVTMALLWPFITALASLFYRAAEANPRTHAFLSTVAGLGIDLPKVWDALGRMVTGNLPPSTAARKAASVRPLTMVLLVVGLALALAGCGTGQVFGPGSTVPADLQAEESCVFDKLQGGMTDPLAVGVACGIPEGKLFTDLLAYALDALGIKIPVFGRQSVGAYVTAKRAAGQ